MPGGQERILRRRINSVQSTKKITRAMELIAATRVVKAMQRANAARPYSTKMTSVIEDLAAGGAGVSHGLLREAETVRSVGFVIITSDRGLAGPYNSAVIRAAEREIMAVQLEGKSYRLVLVGKKARDYFRFRNYDIAAYYEAMTDAPTYDDAREVAEMVAAMFLAEEVDEVILSYQEFISMGTQRVALRRFLPLEQLGTVAAEGGGDAAARASFEFEPSPEGVLETLLPRYVESRLFSALLDASASEHANRQRAMKAATDNAEDLITSLSRALSRARQDAITTEIMEIVSGAEALGGDEVFEDGLPVGAVASTVSQFEAAAAAARTTSSSGMAQDSGSANATVVADAPYGAGSHAPMPDNSTPYGFEIKGNADSMLYHRPDSRSYSVTIAEVWFDTPERAEAAGFRLANSHPKDV